MQAIGEKCFHVVALKKGNTLETKIQIYEENKYRIATKAQDEAKNKYYTYQLKSSKGLVVVMKGIDSNVNSEKIKEALEKKGFNTKTVFNILNKEKIPPTLFKVGKK